MHAGGVVNKHIRLRGHVSKSRDQYQCYAYESLWSLTCLVDQDMMFGIENGNEGHATVVCFRPLDDQRRADGRFRPCADRS